MTIQEITGKIAELSVDERLELARLLEERDEVKESAYVLFEAIKAVDGIETESDAQSFSTNIGHTHVTLTISDRMLKKEMTAVFREQIDVGMPAFEAEHGQSVAEAMNWSPEETSKALAAQVEMYASSATSSYKSNIVPMLYFVVNGVIALSITGALRAHIGTGFLQPGISEKEIIDSMSKKFLKAWKLIMNASQQGDPGEWKTHNKDYRMRAIQKAFEVYRQRHANNPGAEPKQEQIVLIISELCDFEKQLTTSTFSRILTEDGEDWKKLKARYWE